MAEPMSEAPPSSGAPANSTDQEEHDAIMPQPEPSNSAAARPTIDVADRELHELADEALATVAAGNDPPTVFVTGGMPSRVVEDGSGARLERIQPAALRDLLSRAARWTRTSRDSVRTVHPPTEVVSNLLARDAYPLPDLERVVTAPILGSSGELVVEPGYHADGRTYYRPGRGMGGFAFSDPVSWMQVSAAREHLEVELLGDFPFASQADRAHAIGLLLLPFLREVIDGPTPLHLIDAPSPGSGKGLLAEALLAPAVGTPAMATAPQSDEEWRKRLTAALAEGPAAIVVDNVSGHLDSPSLAAALTAMTWEDRILGVSQVARFRVRCVWVATLNNASLSTELARRSVRIRLRPEVERPWLRPVEGFRYPDLRGWALGNRRHLVWSALAMCRWWIREGGHGGSQTLGSFQSWSSVVGGVLETAGVEGFLDNLHELYEDADAESSELAGFLEAWERALGDRPVRSRELADAILTPGSPLHEARPGELVGVRDDQLASRVGYLLRRHRETVADGRRIVAARESKKHGNKWRVERVGA